MNRPNIGSADIADYLQVPIIGTPLLFLKFTPTFHPNHNNRRVTRGPRGAVAARADVCGDGAVGERLPQSHHELCHRPQEKSHGGSCKVGEE